jgi:enhancing lycopene biosynthesis protein 2
MRVSLKPKLDELRVIARLNPTAMATRVRVICEGLRLMAARGEVDQLKLEQLRAALIAGEQSGLAKNFSMDQVMAQLDEEAQAETILKTSQ